METVGDQEAFVTCETTKGPFKLQLVRKWSPIGYDRAVSLFQRGFYDHSHFFRTVHGFLVQFGISYTTDVNLRKYAQKTIRDDPQLNPPIPFEEGFVSFAGSGKNSRTSHLFIAYDRHLYGFGTELWETPVGKVIEGMANVREFCDEYGDEDGPEQWRIEEEGLSYMEKNFPHLDKFETCTVKIVFPNVGHNHNRELLSGDLKPTAPLKDSNIPKASDSFRVKENHQNNFKVAAPSKVSGLLKFDSDSTKLIGFAGVCFLVAVMFALRRKEKHADKKN